MSCLVRKQCFSYLLQHLSCSAAISPIKPSVTYNYHNKILKVQSLCSFHRSIIRSYRAAVMEELGKPLIIRTDLVAAKLSDKQVNIQVESCGVNMSDLFMCRGIYENAPKKLFVPGFEICGKVIEKGSKVDDLNIGDKVIGLSKETYGGFAEQCILNKSDVWKIPESMPSEKGAALVDSYATVLLGLRRTNIQPKDYVLVTAASGGLGLAAVDIAANLYKAKVIGACGTEDKATVVRDKGAFNTVNYNKKEIIEAVKKLTDKKGVKVIFEAVGGDITSDCLQCIAHEGSIIVAGFASRRIPHIPTSLLLPKSCALIGVSLTHYRTSAKTTYQEVVEEVIEMFKDEFIEPHVSATFNLEQVNEAFKFLEEGNSTGKVVLNMA